MSSPNSVKNPGFAVRRYVNWGKVYAQAGSCDQAFLLEAGPTFCSLSWRSRSLHLMMFPERVRRCRGTGVGVTRGAGQRLSRELTAAASRSPEKRP